MFGAIPAQKATIEAPPYARDKYLKQVQFYQQGASNLRKRASQIQGYNSKDFDAKQEAMAMKLFNQVKTNSISLDVLNQSISGCISEAGLYMADYPR
jgi:endonuclease III